MTGPGPYHEYAEELDSSSGLTRWITGGLTPSLPARTQPILQGSAPVLPPGLFITSNQVLDQVLGIQK